MVCLADPFHMEMIKHTCNSAQDSPGLAQGVKNALLSWSVYRSAALDPVSPTAALPRAHDLLPLVTRRAVGSRLKR